mgnify:CR=1 FL=1
MMYAEKYECGYEIHWNGDWARVVDSNGQDQHVGTPASAAKWLRERRILSLSTGSTRAERLAHARTVA